LGIDYSNALVEIEFVNSAAPSLELVLAGLWSVKANYSGDI